MITESFKPLPGEHVYSWLLRRFKLSAYCDVMDFQKTIHHECFEMKSNNVFDSATKLMLSKGNSKLDAFKNNTLLPFWQISMGKVIGEQEFQSDDLYDLYTQMDDKTVLEFDRSWHSCSQCRKDDINKYGTSYWHTEHQILSVYECLKHKRILEFCVDRVVDLRNEILPHDVKLWKPLIKNISEELVNWQSFVISINRLALSSPEIVSSLKYKILEYFNMDEISLWECRSLCESLNPEFEKALGPVLLRYLFKEYSRPSKKGSPQILMTLFSRVKNPYKIRTPIYWLAVAYWLKDDIKLFS
jgi:hypothetical protein